MPLEIVDCIPSNLFFGNFAEVPEPAPKGKGMG